MRVAPGTTVFVGPMPLADGRELGALIRAELVQPAKARELDPR